MNTVVKIRFSLYLSMLALLLAGCMVQLAPRHDAALYDGIVRVNVRIMEFFASVSPEVDGSAFASREDRYNSLIGTVNALAMQSRARPIPNSEVRERVNAYLGDRGQQLLGEDEAPSAAALDEVSRQLAKMKETDQQGRLRPGAVDLFRNAVIISMDQAITYESFLER